MKKTVIISENAPKAIGPYSHAVCANGFVFTSGQIPADPATGAVVQGDIRAQAERVFQNLEAVLAAAGAGFADVVKTTVFLRDMKDFAAVNEVYAAHFTGDFPARSCVQAAALPKDVGVEIEMVAIQHTRLV
jgi:2-iminobutanoate/2-iminopropanoate deaminase